MKHMCHTFCRLIDIVMSNCIHSNIFKIYILTQVSGTAAAEASLSLPFCPQGRK